MPTRYFSITAGIILIVIAFVWISSEWSKKKNTASAAFLQHNNELRPITFAPAQIRPQNSSIQYSASLNPPPTPINGHNLPPPAQEPSQNKNDTGQTDNSLLNTFNDYDEAQKLTFIADLPPHPENPAILQHILRSEQSAAVKISVIGHLQKLDSSDAQHLIIAALDDSADAVAVIALNSLAAKADESLLATLSEKMHSLPDGTLKNFYSESIERIQMRLTFGHSDLAQQ